MHGLPRHVFDASRFLYELNFKESSITQFINQISFLLSFFVSKFRPQLGRLLLISWVLRTNFFLPISNLRRMKTEAGVHGLNIASFKIYAFCRSMFGQYPFAQIFGIFC